MQNLLLLGEARWRTCGHEGTGKHITLVKQKQHELFVRWKVSQSGKVDCGSLEEAGTLLFRAIPQGRETRMIDTIQKQGVANHGTRCL